MSFQYDCGGTRTRKIVDGVETRYYLKGSQIQTQITGNERLDFLYDEQEQLLGVQAGEETFYYIRNMQQDIIGILDKEGNQVVSYTYDSWGKLIAVTGSKKDSIGQKNPFRYRGYYYDVETGLFYVGSRYYDPQIGRFINADDTDVITSTMDDVTDKNLFAYCDNNPVMRVDKDGNRWSWGKAFATIGIVAGVVALGALVVVSCGTAAPAAAMVGGGIFSGGFGFSAATVATASTVAYWSGAVAVNSASAAIYLAKTKSDPHARPGQKKQGRENKIKSREKDNFKSRNNRRDEMPASPKKHTPSRKGHSKFFPY